MAKLQAQMTSLRAEFYESVADRFMKQRKFKYSTFAKRNGANLRALEHVLERRGVLGPNLNVHVRAFEDYMGGCVNSQGQLVS
jgi:hypothetical protein